jgi:hypothetical protein
MAMSIELTEQQQPALDDFKAEDAFQAQIESAAEAGWADPLMDVYNELDPRNHQSQP